MNARHRILGLVAVLLGCYALVPSGAWAQVPTNDVSRLRLDQTQAGARLEAVIANRQAVEAAVLVKWQNEAEDGGFELASVLPRLSAEQLLRAQDAQSAEDLNAAIYGRSARFDPSLVNSLGEGNSDLVYFPVTPCRIIDTRNAGGILIAGATRSFDSQGPFTGQGGSATSCGLPGSDTAALVLTITVVGSTGPGDLRAWPYGLAAPLASVINYANTPGLALANTHIVPLDQNPLNAYEFNVLADASNVHLVADVVGYFWSPNQTAVGQVILETTTNVLANASFTIASPACPVGTRVMSGGWRADFFGAPVTMATSKPTNSVNGDVTGTNVADRWLVQGVNSANQQDYHVWVVCAAIPGR
jgi:hypothetical protein